MCRPVLPAYLLDFGHIVLGTVCTQTVVFSNTGWFPVSFNIERSARSQLGFCVDLARVYHLPEREAVECLVTFDPRAANLSIGPAEVTVPINV